MSNIKTFAQTELDILVKSATDPNNRPIIEEFIPEILALVEKFGKSGQSGGSAPYTAGALSSAIKKLCLQKPICPIMGIDEEWNDVSGYGSSPSSDIVWQNKRCYALFKNKEGVCNYSDAITWKTQTGSTWSGSAKFENGEKIRSSQQIKGFPFEPKTFVIDVIEKEVRKDDWEFYIKDENQLDEVFEYYQMKNTRLERDKKIGSVLE